MLFNSTLFLAFLPVALLAYHASPERLRKPVLLLASYWFYAAWDLRFLSLLVVSTLVDFYCARGMVGANERTRRHLLWISLITNLGILGTFKYMGFFVDSLRELLAAAGLQALDSWSLDLILPLGISFYTFQTLAYTIDVKRGRITACENLLDYSIFVAYWPQLVAGPIERASRLLPQLVTYRRPDVAMVRAGLTLVLFGFFKKVFIGDALVSPYVDAAFADPRAHDPAFLLLGACLFSIQIYADFSGYTDIARGVSRLLGVELMINFAQPFLSRNITEFWRRWHISLSTWLRDYLYIPLGGNRAGDMRTYRNLMVTMLLGGLWHGAAWNFVIWGGVHGLLLALHRMWGRERGAIAEGRRWPWLRVGAAWFATHLAVVLAFVFFRAPDAGTAFVYLAGLAGNLAGPGAVGLALVVLAVDGLLIGLLELPARLAGRDEATEGLPAWLRAPAYALLMLCIWTAWPASKVPFIYFQF